MEWPNGQLAQVYLAETVAEPVTVDVSMSEDHQRSAEISAFPVETGAVLSDHRRLQPRMLTMRGVVTETPSVVPDSERIRHQKLAQDTLNRTPSITYFDAPVFVPEERGKAGYAMLERMFEASELLFVVTDLRIYENMQMTELSVHRDGETGRALDFSATFKEVFIAKSERVDVEYGPTRVKSAPKKKDLGKTAPTAANPADKDQSLAVKAGIESGYLKP